ncbi:MAG TPA: hypothetical protein VME22_18515 [Solirubrobacteraceae bacterium]|nr:hypothetical protein [Solirubrobacteraceae bacterium]
MNPTDRIANLMSALDRPTPIEAQLLYDEIIDTGTAITGSPGSSAPPLVVLESRLSAFHKRFHDQDRVLCQQYGHHPFDVPLNEVTAWRLAAAIGNPWRQLLPTAVLRVIDNKGGALINDKKGKVDAAVFTEAVSQVDAAAFWDALIGNQDRNMRNFRYDAAHRRLGLIDHGFVFARPGDLINRSSYFLATRLTQSKRTLTQRECDVLEALLEADLYGLRRVLAVDRADALQARAERMLSSRLLPPVQGGF